MRVEAAEETPRLTGEFTGETYRVLEHTQTHPPGNQHQKGPTCLWVAAGVTQSLRAEQAALFPLRLLPHIMPQHSKVDCPALVNTYGSAPYYITGTPRQKKNVAQMKEQIKALEKIKVSDKDIANI